jgi:hypothetical protein
MMGHNTKVSSMAYGDWRVDPDGRNVDRMKPGEVKTYKLSPEELAKYQNVKPYKKPEMAGVEGMCRKDCKEGEHDMLSKKVTKEQLIELCRKYGFSQKAYTTIAEEVGLQMHTIECSVSRWGIRKIVEGEHKKGCEEVKGDKAMNENAKVEIVKAEKDPAVLERAAEKIIPAKPEVKKTTLKPKALISQAINGMEYDLLIEGLRITYKPDKQSILVAWDDIDTYLAELKEIQQITN